MTPVDILTLIAFGALVLLGLAVTLIIDWRKQRPSNKIRQQLDEVIALTGKTLDKGRALEFQRAREHARRRHRYQMLGALGRHLARLEVVAGKYAALWLIFVMGAAVLVSFILLLTSVIPILWWVLPLALIGWPVVLGTWFYRWQINRFKKQFLVQLPDALDAIVRASQAGVPVTRSIRAIGQDFPAPLGPEFLKMGDSFLLGHDLEDVMEQAVQRINLAEFTFFSVCVLLQRESGGSVAEALENLADIIRSRHELGLKARALTAEGRISGSMLSALPFLIIGIMYLTSREYIEVLFVTELGRTLLTVAGIMLIIGIVAIRKLSQLKV